MENEKGRRGQSRNVENAASKSATPASSIGQWRCTKLEKKNEKKRREKKRRGRTGLRGNGYGGGGPRVFRFNPSSRFVIGSLDRPMALHGEGGFPSDSTR